MLAETLQVIPEPQAVAPATSARRSRWFFPVLAFLAGSLNALLLIGWGQIDPTNLAWIRNDPAVYQAGWEFLRRQPWTFPPTWLAHLDFPFGISAAYLDVIPIVAVPLHVFARVLPENFQYLGLWAMLCLILQAYFALKLLSRFFSDRVILCLGALFFLNAPILLIRLYGHFSLCGQWLILAAFYYYFQPLARTGTARYMAPFAVLAAIAGGITPYLTVMVLVIGFAAVLRSQLENTASFSGSGERPISRAWYVKLPENGILWLFLPPASAVLAFLVFGFVTPGSGPIMTGSGYGMFSMNLLAPFNPGDMSLLFKSIAVLPAQVFEGYAYLGLGVILLGLICLARRPRLLLGLGSPSLRPLLYVSVLLTFAALSIRIVAGQTVVLTIPVTPHMFQVLAIFRSSGRFFWPVYYLLFVGALVGALSTIAPRWARYAVLAAACLLQYFDTLPLREGVAQQASITAADPLSGSPWADLGRSAAHMIVLPAWQCDSTRTPVFAVDWPWFARLAARSGMTLNSVHAARSSLASSDLNCRVLPERVSRGLLDRNSAYILGDRLALLAAVHNTTHYCRRVGNLNLCTFDPAHAAQSSELSDIILPPYILGTAFEADRPPPRSMLMDGWDLRAAPAVWTVGREASLYLRAVLRGSGDLRLEMEFGGNGAFLTTRHRLQHAIVSVNGNRIGILTFGLGGANRERTLAIPARLLGPSGIVEIGFQLPDAVAPGRLGINADDRQLGLYVARIRLVGNQ